MLLGLGRNIKSGGSKKNTKLSSFKGDIFIIAFYLKFYNRLKITTFHTFFTEYYTCGDPAGTPGICWNTLQVINRSNKPKSPT